MSQSPGLEQCCTGCLRGQPLQALCKPHALPPSGSVSCSANDRGMELFAAGHASAAFDCFTEAVRLRPTSAVYHANRAAAALKLGRADLAVEAAAAAAKRDSGYLRAHLRLGRALLALAQPADAEAAFKQVLELEPRNAAAARGVEEAARLAGQQRVQHGEDAAAAAAGSRPALSRGAVGEEDAVAQLLSAEQMLAANPRLQASRTGCAETAALMLPCPCGISTPPGLPHQQVTQP